MSIAVGEVVRVVCKLIDVNGSQIQNVFYAYHSGSSPVAEATFLSDVETKLSATYGLVSTLIPNTTTSDEISCDVVEFIGGKETVVRPVGDIAWTTWSGGTASGEGLPQQDCALVQFPAGSTSLRGSKYIGPLAETAQANGSLTSAAVSALTSWAAAVVSGFIVDTTEQFYFAIMSTKFATHIKLASSIINSLVATQRRRRAGRGI